MSENAASRVMSGASWADFCDALKAAGDVVLREGSPQDAFDRAEGFRYLSRLTRVALESYLEFADPAAPVLRRPSHETVKIGADNPDNYYQSAAISGRYSYRIIGQRGSVPYLGFGTYVGSYGSDERMGQSGYLEGADLRIEPDGSFEILVSCPPDDGAPGEDRHRGNWLAMEPESSSLIVRQTFHDREKERVAELRIERIDSDGPPDPLTAELLDRGLAAASSYVTGTSELFADWAEGFAAHPNELRKLDPAVARAAHGDPNICYFHGYWELGRDEALRIEVTPPDCVYWNFQLNNHWMESLDYRYHRIALNHTEARLRADGSVRLIVAHRDPGVENWLDTAGHARGTMCLRWIRAEHHPDPVTRLVKLAELTKPRP